jgi:thiol-disulfide isomerase/thioredoxin
VGETPKDQFDRWQPTETVRTLEIRELPGGAFYPVKTVREMWAVDSDAPMPTEAELEEIRAGTRKQALVVHRRYTWGCSIVEIKQDYPDGFFVIPFPDDQPLHDHDTGKLVGAPERKPLVEVGQEAPPLSVALWLDGKERTLADLKGQVVVLDFWGLWCSACRSGVPGLKTLQEGFRDKPVTFISIHTGEKKPLEAMGRIREFKTKNDWSFLGAIDKGRISEDSVTSNAYGIRSFPTLVIIGKDGRIAYVDPDLDGPACDEENPALIAEYEQRVSEVMKPRYAAVGETWPISSELPEEEQRAIFARAEAAYIKLQIEMALGK